MPKIEDDVSVRRLQVRSAPHISFVFCKEQGHDHQLKERGGILYRVWNMPYEILMKNSYIDFVHVIKWYNRTTRRTSLITRPNILNQGL